MDKTPAKYFSTDVYVNSRIDMQSFFYHISTMKIFEAGGCLNEFENLAGTHSI
jgi:hypothetical protein